MAVYLLSSYEFHLIYVAKLPKRICVNSLKTVRKIDLFVTSHSFYSFDKVVYFPSDVFKRVKQQVLRCVGVCKRRTICSFAMRIDSQRVKFSVQSQKDSAKCSQRENISPKESLYVNKRLNNVHTNHYS